MTHTHTDRQTHRYQTSRTGQELDGSAICVGGQRPYKLLFSAFVNAPALSCFLPAVSTLFRIFQKQISAGMSRLLRISNHLHRGQWAKTQFLASVREKSVRRATHPNRKSPPSRLSWFFVSRRIPFRWRHSLLQFASKTDPGH